jgi:hypothetical protein
MMKCAAFFLAAFTLLGIQPNARADNQGHDIYFCPWADMVLRIDYDRGGGHVAVTSGTNVPTPGSYDVQTSRVVIGTADVMEAKFAIPDSSFWYTFVLQIWPDETVRLDNIRIHSTSQKTWKQSGYCFVVR